MGIACFIFMLHFTQVGNFFVTSMEQWELWTPTIPKVQFDVRNKTVRRCRIYLKIDLDIYLSMETVSAFNNKKANYTAYNQLGNDYRKNSSLTNLGM